MSLSHSPKLSYVEYILATIGSIIVVYFCMPVSKDIANYQEIYLSLPATPAELIYSPTSEYLFWGWLTWVKYLGGDLIIALAPLAFISLVIKLNIFRVFSRDSIVSYFLYFAMIFLLHEGTQFRISIALAFALLSCFYITQYKWARSFIFFLLASQFHITATLIPILFYLAYNYPRFRSISWLLLPISILFFICKISIFHVSIALVANFLGGHYLDYINSSTGENPKSYGGLAFITCFLLLLIKTHIDQNPHLKSTIVTTCLSICVIGNSFQFLFYDSLAISSRIAELLTIFIIPPLAIIINSSTPRIQYVSLISLSLLLLIRIRLLY